MLRDLMEGVRFTLVAMLVFGGAYHAAMWGLGRAAFPLQAQGSLLQDAAGGFVGSTLVAQAFASDRYFHPRPSAVAYNAASTGGSNLGASNPDHLAAVRERLAAIVATERVPAGVVPSEMVTESGSGLDPHVSPAAAAMQVPRVSRARGADPAQVQRLVDEHTLAPTLGVFGPARVNVLALNLALDRAFPPAPTRASH